MTDSTAVLSAGRTTVRFSLVILLGILLRLNGITAPPHGPYAIREADTAAIARNFHKESFHPFYPQIDWRGSTAGYLEAEFQAYTMAVAGLYELLGPHEWIARGLNVLIYAVSALFLFRLITRLYDERAGLLAALFYSVLPLSVFFTRSIQPNPLMCLASLLGLYYFLRWSESAKRADFLLSVFATSLAVLIQPTSLYLGAPLAYLAYRRFGSTFLAKPALWFYAALVILPSAFWYLHARSLWLIYGNTVGIFGGMNKLAPEWTATYWFGFGKLMIRRTISLALTLPGVLLFLLGFFRAPRDNNYLLHFWGAGFVLSAIIAAEGHRHHHYYQLPAVFLTASWMAAGLARLSDLIQRNVVRQIVVCGMILLVCGLSLWELRNWMPVSKRDQDRMAFALRIQELTRPEDRLVLVSPRADDKPAGYHHRYENGKLLAADPVDFYLSRRKGWSIDEEQATSQFVEELRTKGAAYLATSFAGVLVEESRLKEEFSRRYLLVEATPKWIILRLDSPKQESPH